MEVAKVNKLSCELIKMAVSHVIFTLGSAQRVGFGSGRSVEIYDQVFLGISFIFRYFRVFLGISGISGYVGYFRVFLGLPIYTRVI